MRGRTVHTRAWNPEGIGATYTLDRGPRLVRAPGWILENGAAGAVFMSDNAPRSPAAFQNANVPPSLPSCYGHAMRRRDKIRPGKTSHTPVTAILPGRLQ